MTQAAELSDEVRTFLQEARLGVLATINQNGTPQQSAIWYELRDGTILMNTKRGRVKDRNLRRDPRCSLCVADEYRYVTLRGSVTLIDDERVAQADIKHLATRYDGPESAERQMRRQFSREARVTIHLSIDRVQVYGFGES